MNIAKMMQQAQQLQSKLVAAKEKLAQETLTVEAVGGKIKVTVTGEGHLAALELDPSIIDPQDTEFLQEVVLKAIQDAQRQAKEKTEAEMQKLTGGMGLPPGLL